MEIDYLQLAINEAWKYQFLTYPNPAVGAVVIVKNKIFVNAHKKAGEPHAEVNVLWDAFRAFHNTPNLTTSKEIHEYLYQNHNNFFKDAILYVTLEPCNHYGKTPACASLIEILKPKKVVIGYKDPIKEHSGGIERLKNKMEVVVLNDKRCFDLIEPFIKWQKRFIFFKLAQTLNGVISGGYISSEDSLTWVHKIRNNLDLLVIGGNTVRIDRPTLDSRRVKGKNPDILIYSKQKNFDKNIPLFNIQNRKVFIEDNLEKLQNYNFIMIEGGEKLYNELKDLVDWKVFIVSPKFSSIENFKSDDKLEILHIEKNDDFIIWSR